MGGEDGQRTRRGAELAATRDGPAPPPGRDLEATTDAAPGNLVWTATREKQQLGASALAPTTDSLPRSTARTDVPQRLGRYLVIQQLGAGGMGVVFKAYDPDLDRKVAIKLLRGQATEHARARLLREAQAMAKLSHPGVVPVFDVGTAMGQVFVAMDFVAGETLQTWMKPTKPWREVLEVFEQAGLGLAAAHAVGLVHRDFKPETWSPPRTAPLPPTGRILKNGGDLRGGLRRWEARRAAVLATGWQRTARNCSKNLQSPWQQMCNRA